MKFIIILSFLIIYLFNSVTFAQINGEFWWLNSKLAAITGIAPSAKFESLEEFDNDENDKVVFKNIDINSNQDIDLNISYNSKPNKSDKLEELNLKFTLPKFMSTTKVNETINKNIQNITIHNHTDNIINKNNKTQYIPIQITTEKNNDRISFSFPKEISNNNQIELEKHHRIVFPSEENKNDFINNVTIYKKNNNKTILLKYKSTRPVNTDVEFICTFISYDLCHIRKGFVYEEGYNRQFSKSGKIWSRKTNVCCIFHSNKMIPIGSNFVPLLKSSENKIRFPRSVHITEDAANRGHKQRENLLKNIFNVRPLTTVQTKIKKIVNDYDYVDPYWNIKNTNLKLSVKVAKPTSDPYDVIYDTVESTEDYADEVPTPGFLGSYSAQSTRRPLEFSWAANNKRPSETFNSYSGNSGSNHYNGYSTLDPRLDDRTSFKRPKPIESSSEEIFDAESHIVTYQANPDFQVLQDFKLLNLIRNKSRLHDRNSKKSTTDQMLAYDSLESTRPSFSSSSSEVVYDDVDNDDKQVYGDCGRRTVDYDSIDDESDVSFGTHPWILLVVRTKKQHRTLCSATLVHPRAAITAATCVNGAAAGEVVVRAGEWDLREVGHSQQRLSSIYVHPRYQEQTLNHNLAILHWKRPLQMTPAVQPACLGDPDPGSSCNFVGWGGINKNIRSRPQIQRASIFKRRLCSSHLNNADLISNMPQNAFCAITNEDICVSGIGASLLCSQNGRVSAVGVSVWRPKCDRSPQILLQTRDWIRRTLPRLGIQ